MRLLPLLLTGCLIQPWQGEPPDTDTDTNSDTDTDTDVGNVQIVQGTVPTTTWTNDTVWRLQGMVFVEGQLTIQPGTRIEGEFGSALIVTRQGRLIANGSEDAPIVFTSSNPDPAPGDWGGVALLGEATVTTRPDGTGFLDGTGLETPAVTYGGTDDAGSCGSLGYVRIEFAGAAIGEGDELNGLTMAGCGAGTLIQNVHVHNSLDDGVQIFGGSVSMCRLLITRAGDDGLDWEDGWTGNAQFVIIQQDDVDHGQGRLPDRAIEGDSRWDRMPRSQPIIENLTLIGSASTLPEGDSQRGITLRQGSGAHLANVIMMGFTYEGIDISDQDNAATPTMNHERINRTSTRIEAGDLRLRGGLFWDIGATGDVWGPNEPTDGAFIPSTGDTAGFQTDAEDDDHSFDELAWLTDPINNNLFVDPRLAAPFSVTTPNFVPALNSPAMAGVPTSDNPFFITAEYRGAIAPGAPSVWYAWTEFL